MSEQHTARNLRGNGFAASGFAESGFAESRAEGSHWHPSVGEQLFGAIDPESVLKRCGRTFYAASRVLPADVRHDLAVLYAFCRVVDDCADLAADSPLGPSATHELLAEIESCLHGTSTRSPIVCSFRELAKSKGVPLMYAFELIEGVRSDLGRVRVKTSEELVRYAFRVASTVGLMMCRILEVDSEGDPFAVDLGIGMQLTNIARDVAEDAANDRVYVPAEWVDHATLLDSVRAAHSAPEATRPVQHAVEQMLSLADEYYESAELGMHFLPARVRGGIRSAAWNYRAIGAVVRRDPALALQRRASTSGLGKLVRTGTAVWASVLESLPLGPADRHDTALHAALAPLGLRPVTAGTEAG
ncbi:MAG: phytoene/squalene synthase family protein [Planctomycetota bacterium]